MGFLIVFIALFQWVDCQWIMGRFEWLGGFVFRLLNWFNEGTCKRLAPHYWTFFRWVLKCTAEPCSASIAEQGSAVPWPANWKMSSSSVGWHNFLTILPVPACKWFWTRRSINSVITNAFSTINVLNLSTFSITPFFLNTSIPWRSKIFLKTCPICHHLPTG